jgi:hypothetical protein
MMRIQNQLLVKDAEDETSIIHCPTGIIRSKFESNK